MTQTNGLGRFEIALLVGTRKGGFVLSSGAERKHWELSEVHCRGGDVYHFVQDARNGVAVYSGCQLHDLGRGNPHQPRPG